MSPATRWCPTAEQLMALEEMYRGGTRSPNAAQIQKITAHLGKYGRVEGKNVFYWFQNHKARERQRLRRKLSSHHRHYFGSMPPMPHLPFYYNPSFLPHPRRSLGGGFNVEEEPPSQVMNNSYTCHKQTDHDHDQAVESRWYKQKHDDLMMGMVANTPRATSTPTKTLELFPLTATNLKWECK